MDFGKILDDWEKGEKKRRQKEMEAYLEHYLPDPHTIKEKELQHKNESPGAKRARLRQMKPQRTLDLHGMQSKSAFKVVDRFLVQCKKDGIKKVLIIHGKGNHSKEPYVLARKIKEYIQHHPLAGECGTAEKNMGGSGALWVLIR
jgi:DNA-nicking Smr family endonuclease